MLDEIGVFPPLSLNLLLFIRDNTGGDVKHVEFLGECCTENYFYLTEEKRLIISESFRKDVLIEIKKYIDLFKVCEVESGEYKQSQNAEGMPLTIYGRFSVSDLIEETILWDLLTLMIFLDSSNPQIWDRRVSLIKEVLDRNKSENDLVRFVKSEISLTKMALSYAFKYGEIWSYFEYITKVYFEFEKNANESDNSIEIIEQVIEHHYDFICLQFKLYDHNYYIWSFVNWMLFELIPRLIPNEKEYDSHEIAIIQRYIIKLIKVHPLQYGGYHTLVNLTEFKLNFEKRSEKIDVEVALRLVYNEEVIKMLEVIVNCFDSCSTNCLTVIMGFRYAIFLLLIDFTNDHFHFRIFENEVRWFKNQGIVEKVSKNDKYIQEVREHFYLLISEISSYKANEDFVKDYTQFLNSELSSISMVPEKYQ
ncbi:hypothetical protein HWI79_1068 [Cryptosporidium felis]|nr:hypothetical protein HWI79_1068 [Cryptosporidium felis]